MSDDNTVDDKEANFAALRAEKEALAEQLAALQPLAVERAVRSAGFDPDTPEGKALTRLSTVDSDADAVRSLAEELGFEAAKPPQLNPTEQAMAQVADRSAQLGSVSVSDSPSTVDDEITGLQAALAAARTAKNWDEAKAIGAQLTKLNSQKLFAQVMSHE